jgi:mercuric ion binding protein
MRTVGLAAAALVVTFAVAISVVLRTHSSEPGARRPTSATSAPTRVVTLSVPEMDCAGCAVGVKVAAGKVEGVYDVKVDLETRLAMVSFDPARTTPEAIADAITRGTGFTAKASSGAKAAHVDRSDP